MRISELLQDKIVKPSIQNISTNNMAIIYGYDQVNNTASIYYTSNNLDAKAQIVHGVPIKTDGCGLHSSSFSIGDKVVVSFMNNSRMQPVITGKYDDIYALNTREKEYHIEKGELINSAEYIDEMPEPALLMIKDEENKTEWKYSEFKDIMASSVVSEYENMHGRFNGKDIGLYNEKSNAVIKILDDGSINIFTGFNTGIRINSKNKTIETFGNLDAISNNWSVISNNVNIQSDVINIKSESLNVDSKEITVNGVKINA